MAYIKKLKYNELVGGTDNTDVYPVTSTEAVYGPDNISQQAVNEDRLRRIELLENNVQSLDGLKEMVEALISGDYDHHGGLSDNNFTDELKAKLEGLENYNDAELRQLLADINTAKADAKDVYTKEEIDDKLGDIQGALTFDDVPSDTDNPVKSRGIKSVLDELGGRIDAIVGKDASLSLTASHSSIFAGTIDVTVTATASRTAESIVIKKGNTTVASSENSTTASFQETVTLVGGGSVSYNADATILGVHKTTSKTIRAYDKVYYGEGTESTYSNLRTDSSVKTSVSGTYNFTFSPTSANKYIYILVPTTMSGINLNNVKLDTGFGYNLSLVNSSVTYNDVQYRVYRSVEDNNANVKLIIS